MEEKAAAAAAAITSTLCSILPGSFFGKANFWRSCNRFVIKQEALNMKSDMNTELLSLNFLTLP
jgi:hypothetical protein